MYQNLALVSLGAIATASSAHANFPVAGGIDGNDATRWSTNFIGTQGHWFAVDLGSPVTISHMRLWQYEAAANSALSIRVYYSDNGVDYTQLELRDTPDYDYEWDIVPTSAQHWKISRETGGGNTWTFWAWEIWGDPEQSSLDPECDYDQILWDVWDQTGLADKSSVINAYGIPYLAGTGSLYNYLAAILCRLNTLHDKVDALGEASGECQFDDSATLAAIANLDSDLQSAITVIATNDNSNKNAIMAKLGPSGTSLEAQIDARTTTITDSVFARGTDVITAVGDASDDIQANDNSNTSGLIGLENSNHTLVMGAIAAIPPADLSSVLTAIAAQTVTLLGEDSVDHSEIMTAIAALPLGTLSNLPYPGPSGVDLGTTLRVVNNAILSASTHGVGGQMDGVFVSVVSVPPRVTERSLQGHINYRYPGWIAFGDSEFNWEEPQWMNMGHRVYVTKAMANPAYVLLGFADGVTADVTPWKVAS